VEEEKEGEGEEGVRAKVEIGGSGQNKDHCSEKQ
jgi:hypothetical protein